MKEIITNKKKREKRQKEMKHQENERDLKEKIRSTEKNYGKRIQICSEIDGIILTSMP